MKNRDLIAINLDEAIEQLQETAKELRENPDFSEIEFQLDLEHVYHHVNFAWHIRNETQEAAAECSEANYAKWAKFPIGEINEYE